MSGVYPRDNFTNNTYEYINMKGVINLTYTLTI